MHSPDNWFKDWFNTPFYHILYGNRNEAEAALFIANILEYLKPAAGSRVLDLACGKGRHAKTLARYDLNVTGIDLSEASIAEAAINTAPNLTFAVHDMREPFAIQQFDYVFNLFTSFGYFDDPADNLKTIKAVAKCLKPGGVFVLDFFNRDKICPHIIPHEIKTTEGITFTIDKRLEHDYIYKSICFSHEGKDYKYHEKVHALSLDNFKELYMLAGMTLLKVFGNYNLDAFDPAVSDRLIMITQTPL